MTKKYQVNIRREVTVTIDQVEMLMEQRRGYLVMVDGIERHLGLERTSRLRDKCRQLQLENERLRQQEEL